MSGQAEACRVSSAHSAFIHDALPTPWPAGAIIAEVELETAPERQIHEQGIRARVRRMVQGDYRGAYLLAWPSVWSSCSHPLDNGTIGLIVAVPRGMRGDLLVVDPIEVVRNRGFRLDDGFQLPPGHADHVRLPD